MFTLIAFQRAQQRQFGGGEGGGGTPKRKGGARDFLALVGRAPMGSAVIPAGTDFPASPTDVTGTGMAGATTTANGAS